MLTIVQSNIFISDEGRAVIADFGLVTVGEATVGRMTTLENIAGTVRWMSPERLGDTDARLTAASDVYSFGCLCLTVCPH
jgi:serine/threonine protein kinase